MLMYQQDISHVDVHCMYSFYYMYMYVLLTIELALGGGVYPFKIHLLWRAVQKK